MATQLAVSVTVMHWTYTPSSSSVSAAMCRPSRSAIVVLAAAVTFALLHPIAAATVVLQPDDTHDQASAAISGWVSNNQQRSCHSDCASLGRSAISANCAGLLTPASQQHCICASKQQQSGEAYSNDMRSHAAGLVDMASHAAESQFCRLERAICKELCGSAQAVFT